MNDANAALLTDLYELTMAASYFEQGMNGTATFELFVRRLPGNRNFLIAAGLDDALHYLETFRFDADSLEFLRSMGIFKEPFLGFLGGLRFTGEVWAMPEGEAFFPGEPILRLTAPLIEAQIVETFLLNGINFQSLIASKSARVAIACKGREFVDFSPRRDQGPDAALKVARASYIGGAAGTSNVLAGRAFGIPLSGTMAHSYILSFEDEADAFRAFARDFPERSILLIDTYDTVQAAHRVVDVAKQLAPEGIRIRGVRLDSGDLGRLAKDARAILDAGGCQDTRIFASGDLDEHRIAELVAGGAPIDAFGVGTQLGTSADAPALGGVYKLVEDEAGPKVKHSPEKVTWAGKKQVFRFEDGGHMGRDIIALEHERFAGGRPLLRLVMQGGRRTEPAEPLDTIRARAGETLESLPPALRQLKLAAEPYPVSYSPELQQLQETALADTS